MTQTKHLYLCVCSYSTMLACWEASPSDRPTFPNLVETLGDLLQERVQQVRIVYPTSSFFFTQKKETQMVWQVQQFFLLLRRKGRIIFLWDLLHQETMIAARKKTHLQSQTWGKEARKRKWKHYADWYTACSSEPPHLNVHVHVHEYSSIVVKCCRGILNTKEGIEMNGEDVRVM